MQVEKGLEFLAVYDKSSIYKPRIVYYNYSIQEVDVMAIYRDRLVDVPNHTYRQLNKKSGIEYVYIYTEYFRNESGKSRNRSKAIGVYEPESKKMYPNDNYFAIVDVPMERIEGDVKNVGFAAVTQACFEELGIMKILCDVFGERAAKLIRSICAYIVKEGCVMSYIDDFTEKEFFSNVNEIVTSQMTSEIFGRITQSQMNEIYKRWIPEAAEGYLCYDVTSVSTYSSMTSEAEYGYNRDHDNLPQMNLGLFTSEKTSYPVYMVNYNGSTNDMSNVVYACRNARAAGLKGDFLAVLDGGFFYQKKLDELCAEGITFVVGMPMYLDSSKRYVDSYGNELYTAEHLLGYSGTYGTVIENQEVLGIRGRVLIGLCAEAREMLNDDLTAKIIRYEREMNQIAKYDTVINKKKYTGLFDIDRSADGSGFTYRLNREKEIAARKYFGYFTIFTTDKNATANDIITYYRDKDLDEKMFYDMKVYMNGRRARTHKQSTFDGKYFIVFIALILRTWLKKKLGAYKKSHHLTLKRCLMKLSDVRIYQDESSVRYLKSVTAEQRELLRLCGVDAEQLEQVCCSELQSL